MNTFICILQGLLAGVFLLAGFSKASMPMDKLNEKMPWTADISGGLIRFIGLAEIVGAIGLILPMALGILTVLSTVAAFSLALLMILAMRVHARRKEYKEIITNLVLMSLVILIALFHLL